MQGGLNDRISFRMNRTNTVPIHEQVTHLIAVGLPTWRAVKAGRENPFIKDQDTANRRAITCASLRNGISNFHEVRVPVWAHKFCLEYAAMIRASVFRMARSAVSQGRW